MMWALDREALRRFEFGARDVVEGDTLTTYIHMLSGMPGYSAQRTQACQAASLPPTCRAQHRPEQESPLT
jgi:hypothetical protein